MSEYLSALWNYWIVLVLGGALAIIGAYFDMRAVKRRWPRFWRLWLFIVLIALVWAQALAWFDIHAQVESEKEIAIREGRYYPPKIRVMFGGDTCTVTNIGNFDLRAVRIALLTRMIDLSNCTPRSSLFGRDPDSFTQILRPHETVSAKFWDGALNEICSAYYVGPEVKGVKRKNIVRLLECDVSVYRSADRTAYGAQEYLFIDPEGDCSARKINDIEFSEMAFDVDTGKIIKRKWHNKKVQRIDECLDKIKNNPFWEQYSTFQKKLDQHEVQSLIRE